MKTLSTKFMILAICMLGSSAVYAQQIQKISSEEEATWKAQLEKLTAPHQTSLDKESTPAENQKTTESELSDGTSDFTPERLAEMMDASRSASKSAEFSQKAREKMLKDLEDRFNTRSSVSADAASPSTDMEPYFTQKEGASPQKPSDEPMEDTYLRELKESIHQKNIEQQERIIKQGTASKDGEVVKMGLKIDEKELTELRERATNSLLNSLKSIRASDSEKSYEKNSEQLDSKRAFEAWKESNDAEVSSKSTTYTSFDNTAQISTTTRPSASKEVLPFSQDVLIGNWKIEPVEGALSVGPSQGDGSWYSIDSIEIETRSCYFDDEWTFDSLGSVSLNLQDTTWLEPWQTGDTVGTCGTPVFPHDGSGEYFYFASGNEITVEGEGMFLGLPKVNNSGELTSPSDSVPNSITYIVSEYSKTDGLKRLTLDIEAGTGVWWRFKLVSSKAEFSSDVLVGNWKMAPEPGALAVGPAIGDGSWFSNTEQDVSTRSCYFDDVWTFDEFGNVSLEMDGETWLEGWQTGDTTSFCGTPIAPHDGSGSYFYSNTASAITVEGQGMYLGLPKVYNGGELTTPSEAPSAITYQVGDYTVDPVSGLKRLALDIDVSPAQDGTTWWRFNLVSNYATSQPSDTTVAAVDIDSSDYEVLLAIRDSLGGELPNMWVESISPSQWQGVWYDGAGKVTGLALDNMGLSGDIPNSLSALDQLSFMSMGGNSITGLPTGMGSLTKLGQIWLWGNDIQALPSDFFDLSQTSLWSLDLSDSYAIGNGVLDGRFGSLTKLERLNLRGMGLTGLPAEIGNLKRLREFSLSHNMIETLPVEIGGLDSLQYLYLAQNSLTSLPSTLANLDMLHEFVLWGNADNAADVSVFFGMDSLKILDAHDNSLSGTLEGISGSPNLEYVYLGSNFITGGIPTEISALTKLKEFRVHDNMLDGTLSAELFELPNLYQIELYNNMLTGAFPETAGSSSISSIALNGNNLDSLTSGIGKFPNMTYLDLASNDFSGTLPAALAADTSLTDILLQFNNFSGAIPAEWGGLSQLYGLYLTGNSLDEPLPTELGQLSNLNNLAIDQNNIPGAIPDSYGNLESLRGLYIYQNQLTDLPDLSTLFSLEEVYAYENYFEFDDFEPLMQTPAYIYGIAPQLTPEATVSVVSVGEEVVIDATVGGTSNHYDWYFNGQYLGAPDSSKLTIPAIDLQTAGTYWCEIWNDSVTSVTGLYLESGERTYFISALVSEADSLALVDIYDATNGENWNNATNWLNAPVVMWEGVFLQDGRVTRLDLTGKNLDGGLPPSIGELDALRWISLWNNPNMRFLPGEFYSLSNLSYADLDNSGLTEISPSIGSLTAMDTLWLGNNSFSGPIPKELFDLTGLNLLGLYATNFSGTIPEEISQLTELEALWLSHNRNLSGDIPAGFGDLSNLFYLELSNTPFTGGLENLASLSNLERLFMFYVPAGFESLPSEWSSLTKLQHFGMFGADYSGGVPEVIWTWERLKTLRFQNNNINGPIPNGLSNLDSLTYLTINNNGLTGGFPAEFNASNINLLAMSYNNIDDISVFEQDTVLNRFYAVANKLDFDDLLPFEEYFSTHANYQDFDVSFQQRVGEDAYVEAAVGDDYTLDAGITEDSLTIIDWFQNFGPTEEFGFRNDMYLGSGATFFLDSLTNPNGDGFYEAYAYHDVISTLTDLALKSGNTQIEVLETVSEPDSLALVNFYNNIGNPEVLETWLNGPVEIWEGVEAYGGRVRGLYLYGMEGNIPGAALAQLDALEGLSIVNGGLTGTIPSEIFMPQLGFLDLAGNQLTGSIPSQVINAQGLSFLGLARNGLSGSIPSAIGNLPFLYELYLDNNFFTGDVPESLAQGEYGGFSLDRNRLESLPQGLDSALQYAFYVNFEANNFDFQDLLNASGNVVVEDYTYAPQGSARGITFTGTGNIGDSVTLHAERQHPADEFYWFRSDKNSGHPYFFEIAYTGTDSLFTFTINEDFDQTKYMAVIVNPEYQYGNYPFLTRQISVDPYQKRYATSFEATAWTDPFAVGNTNTSLVGMPDVPPNFDGGISRLDLEWWLYPNWWHNALQPEVDTLKLFYDTNPIPINYIRLHSPANDLTTYTVTLRGAGGESMEIPVFRVLRNDNNQMVFPKTTFAVVQVDLAVTSGSVDAIEIGDTGAETLPEPMLSDQYTDIGPDFLFVEVIYGGLGQSIVLERSTDGENFDVIDSINFTGWYYDQVPPGKYYYRAKVSYPELGVESGYSDTLETGNCEPTFPTDKIWAGFSEGLEGYAGYTGTRDTVAIYPMQPYALYGISDLTAGWYDQFFGFYESPGEFRQKCDQFKGFSYGQVSEFTATYENDTLYVDWWDYSNNVHGLSKFYVIGNAEAEFYEPARPENTQAFLASSENVVIAWDSPNPAGTEYIIQRSVGTAINFVPVDTLMDINRYEVDNTLDGQNYSYRVMAKNGELVTYPSNEAHIVHKAALYEPVSNAITTDITRTSYGGAWGDFDGDGDEDLYVSNAFERSANFLYENTGNGTFNKIVGTVATAEVTFTRASTWGDYDNDGFLDLYVPGANGADFIYRNTGSRSFEKANEEVSTASLDVRSETGVWVDLDNDGYLDLVNSGGQVFMNDGAGTLALGGILESSEGPLDQLPYYFWNATNIDYDNDGDQDIYITSDAYNMLFENDGTGTLTFVENGISNNNVRSRGYTWADFDNDGDQDLITGDFFDETLGMYVNNGEGDFDFIPITQLASVSNDGNLQIGRGYTAGDFNNDGWTDVIWNINGRAMISYNRGDYKFDLVTLTDQAFPLTNLFSHVSVADINKDGALDIFLPNQDFNGNNHVYVGNGNENSWISVKLKGIESNRSGVGAKVQVKANNIWQTQTVLTQNGISSGNSLTSEFGLGTASIVDSIAVAWPSGLTTYATDVSINQLFSMVEVPESAGPTVDANDSTALATLYNEMGGIEWNRKQGWLEGSPLAWEGTNWNDEGRLVSLILNNNNLTDTIPDAITALTALEILDLSSNSIVGPMPASLGDLTGLINLSLNDNQIDGTIPASVGNLVNLQNLDLYNNGFFGELPGTLGGLVELRQFEIHNNGFIGFVPDAIGTLSNIEVLRLDHNDFEGSLPTGLGAMASLKVLYVNDNNFSEELPAELGDLDELLELRAQNNTFIGDLPSEMAQLTGIEYVDLSNNMLTGSLAPLAALDSMYYLNLNVNNFSEMPDFAGNSADSILVKENWLDFGDFETNTNLIEIGRLVIAPQDSLYERVDSLHQVGDVIDISFEMGGAFNTYEWLKDGEPLEGSDNVQIADNSVLIVSPDGPDEGEYVLRVTNEEFPEVTLITRPFNLKLSSLERDKQALLSLIAAVDASGNEFRYQPENWSEENDLTTDWEGVTVTGDRVTGLILPAVIDEDLSDGNQSKIFDGMVPPSFADLSGIQTLDLSGHFLRSFPNISGWPDVTSVDISNNRLNFQAIIPNVKLGDAITYAPQRRYDVTRYDTIQAGDDHVVFINMSGSGLQYQWQFGSYIPGQPFNNDVSPIEGANSRLYTIENIDFDKMGTYRVEITHPQVPNLTITSRNRNIMASTDIFGAVFADGDGTFLTDGEVITYRQTPAGPFVAEDTVNLDGGGEYAFEDVVLGDFVVLVKPDRSVYALSENPGSLNVIQTYYEQAEQFTDASTLEVRERIEGVDIQMVFYEVPEEQETGATFEGLVESEFEEEQEQDEEGARVMSRKKVKRAGCSMRRFVRRGRTDQEDIYELYAYVESDDEGNFNFEGVEDGRYRLRIEYPGVPMDEDSDIEFEVGGDRENQLFQLTATITEDGISVESKEVLYSLKPYIKDIQLFPNPTYGDLKANFLVYRKLNDLKLEMLDVRGVKLTEQELSPKMGLQSAEINMHNYEAGVYFIVFTDEAGTFRQQLKVSKQ